MWLRARSADIAEQIDTSLPSLGRNPAVYSDADYKDSLVSAITATVHYSLDAIERGQEWDPIPPALAEHARRAARLGMGLGALIRRYLSGHDRFIAFIREEIAQSEFSSQGTLLEHLASDVGSLTEHIITSVEHEYEQERDRVAHSPESRRARLVQRLLAGHVRAGDIDEMDYDIAGSWHLGVIALGVQGEQTLNQCESSHRLQLLSVRDNDGTVWGWLGSQEKLSVREFKRLLLVNDCANTSFAVGEPRLGLDGWRQTHQEARFALIVARHEQQGVTRCADVLPVIGAVQNEAIIDMYERSYILPLNGLYKRGLPARMSLLAYFEHGRSASAAARAIEVTPRTVQNHLNEARSVLEAPLNMTGLEIALRLEQLGYMAGADIGNSSSTKRKGTHV